MRTSIILGLQYGDEGKGVTTSLLTSKGDLVVRFNAGQQCGHTVVKDGTRHIFSHFGSGTMNGVDTYFSEYCTFYPKSFYNEEKSLKDNGFNTKFFIHPMTMITTPFDIDFNRQSEGINQHGSVGMGFGATIARNENTPYKLYAIDLTHRDILIHKLNQIAEYYNAENSQGDIASFLSYVDMIQLNISSLSDLIPKYKSVIFEGGQGIMLDMDFGYFPNVTRSNTTSKNAMKIIKEHNLPSPDIYYVMRTYLTRHGNGYMPNESSDLKYQDDTNKPHKYQGNFRQGYHSLQQLKYAINCDSIFSGNDYSKKNLVITCADQTLDMIKIDNSEVHVNDFIKSLEVGFRSVRLNYSTSASTMKLI